MKRMYRALVTAAAALAIIAVPTTTSAVSREADRSELQERLDDVVATGAVGVMAEVADDRGVWRATSGTAELGKDRPVLSHGRFRIGSVTKTFIATVVLQLVDEGRLRLDDTVEDWLPGVVSNGRNITVRELLNHTSGLYDYQNTLPMPPKSDFLLKNRWRTWTPAALVQRGLEHPPTFKPPGSDFSYSNTGYILLGDIIEEAVGRPYAAEIEHRIIRPLGLHATSVPGTYTRIRGPHPRGYLPTLRDGELDLVDFTEMNPSLFGAGGEMISTTADLNRFIAALLDGRLLPRHLLAEMKTPGVEDARYGLGLAWKETSCGVRVYGNDGDALAYQSWSYSTPDRSRRVTLALTPDFSADVDDAVDVVLDEAFCG